MKTFTTIWFGQLVSQVGTAMTRFALLIWAYDQTGSALTLALLGFFSFLPMVLVSPIAGVWVDRLDRRKIMLLADLGAGLMTATLLGLYVGGALEIWHLYLAQALSGVFGAFQSPAYTASITLLLPKKHYARASGLQSLADSGAQVIAPFLGGFILVVLGITAVMLIDIATFLVALVTLTIVQVPRATPDLTTSVTKEGQQLWGEIRLGLGYIWERPGLMGLMLIFTGMNFTAALTWFSVLPAMILARSGGDELALANVQGALGVGGVVGALAVSLWGGPRRKIHGVLFAAALSFFSGDLFLALGRSVPVWTAAAGVGALFIPFISSAQQAIWQAKVPPALQGRVFSVQGALRQAVTPLGYLLGGLAADRWLEPAMTPDGALAHLFGPLVGTGPGAGMALMFLSTAVLGTTMSLAGYLSSAIRNVEDDLPDHDVNTPGAHQTSTAA